MSVLLKELKDAPKDAGLALCTATVLFVLSQDRLNMDMDRDSLELMLNLLDTDSRIKVCTNSFIILNRVMRVGSDTFGDKISHPPGL